LQLSATGGRTCLKVATETQRPEDKKGWRDGGKR
jgi:hypothetical protein